MRVRKVGIIGLGIMGGAFARNLLAAGWRVHGCDIDPARRRAMARAGVAIADDVAALARAVPVILTSLPNPKALQDIVKTIAAAGLPSRIMIESSTLALEDKEKARRILEKAGHVLLDCPISGTGAQARTKDIVVYASGDSASIRRLRPLFRAFARATHDLGAFGNGSRMKYVANLLVAVHNVASAEAMVLGIKAGLAPQTIFALVRAGVGNSRIFELRGPMMVQGRYDRPTMKLDVWQKDLAVIGAFAKKLGCPTPLLRATLPIYRSALAMSHGADDTASVCAVLEKMAGVKRTKGAGRRV